MKRAACFLIVTLTLASLPLLAAESGSFDRELKVTGAVDLDVKTGSGKITVRTGAAGQVRIHGEIRAHDGWFGGSAADKVRYLEQNPPIEQTGNIISVGHIHDRELENNISISYEITVPEDTQLHSSTGSGDQVIDGLRGPVNTGAGSGSVHVSHIGSEVKAHTGSGNITLEEVKARVEASAGSGTIRATGVAGGLHANTGSGNVRFEQVSSGDVEVHTGSGTVELENVRGAVHAETGSGHIHANGQPTSGWELHTASGGIDIHLPPNSAFDLEARTTSGRISVDHPVTVQGSMGSRELRGKVRGGGVLVSLHTTSGDIEVD